MKFAASKTKIPNIIIVVIIVSLVVSATLIIMMKHNNIDVQTNTDFVNVFSQNSKQSYDADYFSTIQDLIVEDDIKFALGETIFQDKSLSKSGKTACISCHKINLAGSDNTTLSIKDSGSLTTVNTPTLFNLSKSNMFLTDGNTLTFESIFTNQQSDHFSMLGCTIHELANKISNDSRYQLQFQKVFGDDVSIRLILESLKYYIFNLTSPNSKFDVLLSGHIPALNENELEGYMIFKSHGCVTCHHGERIGGNILQNINNKSALEFDRYLVKVPALRNIEATSPYLYDGSVNDLSQVIRIMYGRQLNRSYINEDILKIEAFLKTLTSEKFKVKQ